MLKDRITSVLIELLGDEQDQKEWYGLVADRIIEEMQTPIAEAVAIGIYTYIHTEQEAEKASE